MMIVLPGVIVTYGALAAVFVLVPKAGASDGAWTRRGRFAPGSWGRPGSLLGRNQGRS